MRKPTTFIAIAILALMLGACASTNDTVQPTTASNEPTTELPSMAEKQTQIAYTDISADASTKEVVVTESQVLESSATVTQSTDSTMTSSSTLTGTTTNTTGSTSSSTTGNSSMISSSTMDDTDDDDDTVATRTRLRKD